MSTWDDVMSKRNKDDRHKGIANTLTDDDLNTIVCTIDFFGGNFKQDIWDLKVARYRVFDWLAMRVQGRSEHETSTKVLVHSFLKSDGVVSKFIDDLRATDYQVVTDWEDITL